MEEIYFLKSNDRKYAEITYSKCESWDEVIRTANRNLIRYAYSVYDSMRSLDHPLVQGDPNAVSDMVDNYMNRGFVHWLVLFGGGIAKEEGLTWEKGQQSPLIAFHYGVAFKTTFMALSEAGAIRQHGIRVEISPSSQQEEFALLRDAIDDMRSKALPLPPFPLVLSAIRTLEFEPDTIIEDHVCQAAEKAYNGERDVTLPPSPGPAKPVPKG